MIETLIRTLHLYLAKKSTAMSQFKKFHKHQKSFNKYNSALFLLTFSFLLRRETAAQNIHILMGSFGEIKKFACWCEWRKRTRKGKGPETAQKRWVFYSLSRSEHRSLSFFWYFFLKHKTLRKAQNSWSLMHMIIRSPVMWTCSLPNTLVSSHGFYSPLCMLPFFHSSIHNIAQCLKVWCTLHNSYPLLPQPYNNREITWSSKPPFPLPWDGNKNRLCLFRVLVRLNQYRSSTKFLKSP